MALNVLPGHRMLMDGRGHLAVKLTLLGSLISLILSLSFLPVFLFLMDFLYPIIKDSIAYLLLVIVVLLILRERNSLSALIVFLSAGVLGWIVLNFPNLSQPLFPLLSGLFGVSLLLMSLSENNSLPSQDHDAVSGSGKMTFGIAGVAASVMGFVAAFLPGFGSSQAAIIAQQVTGDIGDEGFLALVGGINTANMLVSIGTAFLLGKARNGAIVGVMGLLDEVTLGHLLFFLATCVIAGGVATIIGIYLSRGFCSVLSKVSYQKTVCSVLLLILVLAVWFDGIAGFVVLVTATALGVGASMSGVGKNHLMGCLIVPVIVYLI